MGTASDYISSSLCDLTLESASSVIDRFHPTYPNPLVWIRKKCFPHWSVQCANIRQKIHCNWLLFVVLQIFCDCKYVRIPFLCIEVTKVFFWYRLLLVSICCYQGCSWCKRAGGSDFFGTNKEVIEGQFTMKVVPIP